MLVGNTYAIYVRIYLLHMINSCMVAVISKGGWLSSSQRFVLPCGNGHYLSPND